MADTGGTRVSYFTSVVAAARDRRKQFVG